MSDAEYVVCRACHARAAQEGLNAHDLTFDPVVSTSKKKNRPARGQSYCWSRF